MGLLHIKGHQVYITEIMIKTWNVAFGKVTKCIKEFFVTNNLFFFLSNKRYITCTLQGDNFQVKDLSIVSLQTIDELVRLVFTAMLLLLEKKTTYLRKYLINILNNVNTENSTCVH